MEIQIIDKQENKVQVNTAIGCFNGTWCSVAPADFKRYIVELDSDEVLTLDAIELTNSGDPCIECIDGTIYLTGLVEEIQDKVMILRLNNSVMMLELLPDFDFTQYVGRYVCVKLSDIKLYDTGIY